MNRIFSLVWNRALGVLQVGSELATGTRGGTTNACAVAPRRHPLALACLAALAMATWTAPAWSAQDFTIASTGGDITGTQLGTGLAAGNVVILSSNGTTAGSGNINVNAPVNWSANVLTLTAANNIIIGSTGSLMASGTAGLTLNPSTTNTNTAGTITDTAVAGGTTIIDSGGSLSLAGSGAMSIGSLTDNGRFDISGTSNGVAITSLSGSGAVYLGGKTLTLSNASSTDTFSGAIYDGGTSVGTGGSLVLLSGTETLTGTNTYTGSTTISAGTLALSGSGSVATSSGVIDNGMFDISGTSGATIASLSGTGAVNLGANALTLNNASGSFSGVIGGTGGNLVLTSGTETLTGANTYTGGTVINAGKLVAGNNAALGGGAVTMAGGSTLGFDASVLSLSNNFTLVGATTIDMASGLSGTLAGVISGTSGSLTKTSAGTLILGGANTYTGGTTVNGGTLSVAADNNLGASTGSLALNGGTLENTATFTTSRAITLGAGGGTLQTDNATTLTASGVISGASGSLAKTGTGTLTLNGTNSYGGGTTISAGELVVGDSFALGSGAVTMAGGSTLGFSASGLSLSNNFVLGGATTIDMASGQSDALTGVISGVSGSLTKTGTGTLTLNGANTYGGGTTINTGELVVGSNTALGTGAVTMAGGSTLGFSASGLSLGNTITLNGASTIDVGSGQSDTLSGVISGAGGSLTKTGTGTLTLGGANTYGGGTTINAGELVAGSNTALGTGAVTMAGGSTLGFDASGLSLSNNFTLAGAATVDVASGQIDTLAGVIGGASASLTKTSAGTLTLSGANTYGGGTAVSAGELVAGSNTALGTGAVTMAGGSTLGFSASGLSLGNAITLNGAATINVGSGLNDTLTGVISGASGSLTKTSAGTLTLSGANTYGGGTTINGGTLAVSSDGNLGGGAGLTLNGGTLENTASFALNHAVTLGSAGGTLQIDGGTDLTVANAITGTGSLTQTGGGTLTLDANATTGGSQTYNGAVMLGTDVTLSSTGNGTIDFASTVDGTHALTVNTGGAITFDGTVGGATQLTGLTTNSSTFIAGALSIGSGGLSVTTIGGAITQTGVFAVAGASTFNAGSNAITLSNAANSFGGAVGLTGGNTQIANNGALTLGASSISGTLVATAGGAITQTGALSVSGTSTFNAGSNAITLTNAGNDFTGAVNLSNSGANNVTLSNGSNTLTLGSVSTAGNLTTSSGALNITGNVSAATANLSATGNTLVIGSLITTNGTTLSAGTLQVGNGGTTGSLGGNVIDDTALIFDRSDAVTYAGAVSGTGTLTAAGTGTLTLDGNSSGFAGSTTVLGGTLVVGSVAGNGATLGGNVTVDSGATLRGHGTIGGNVDVLTGGIVTPGDSIGTLTVGGNFTAAQGSLMDFAFGAPGATFQTAGTGDSVTVGGNLELDGATLNVTDAGGMGPGLYNVFAYAGTLTETNGGLSLGSTAGQSLFLQTLTAQKQINLIDTTGYTLDAWNANGQASSTQMGGGSGTWSATAQVWTDATGTTPNGPMSPQPGFAIFGGTAGAVTVDDGAGSVTATGMQFAVNGYTLAGGTLTLVASNGSAPIVRVGDGSSAGVGMTATIGNVIAGSAGLTKTDFGTLVLTGANTYTDNTTITGGTLEAASNGALGSGSATVDNSANQNATLKVDSGVSLGNQILLANGGTLDNAGSIVRSGSGEYAVESDNGSATIDNTGSLQSDGGVILNGGGTVTNDGGRLAATGSTSTGLHVGGAAATITNTDGGSISGGYLGVQMLGGSLDNTGTNSVIQGGGYGVFTDDSTASVTNAAGASIQSTSNDAVSMYQGGTVTNEGGASISGTVGVRLSGDGSVINRTGASIAGSFGVIVAANGTVDNSASIVASDTGVALVGSNDTLVNAAGALIRGGNASVSTAGGTGAVSLTNAGTLDGNVLLTDSAVNAVTLLAGSTLRGQLHIGSNTSSALTLDGSGTQLYSQAVTGATTFMGALTKLGGGNWVLDSDLTPSVTTVSAGTLQIGNGGTVGAITGNVTDNGKLVFDRSDAANFAGTISGTGTLTQAGLGTLALTGANVYSGGTTISAGTLVVDSASLPGAVIDNAALVFDQASNGSFSGAVSGNGSLAKSGAGTLILDGDSSGFTGTTSVQAGTLEVGDAATPSALLGGNVTVDASGTLRGHGTIGGNVTNNGTLWAGGSIGTLTIQGNYTQAAQGVFEVEATPAGQASLLRIGGSASLAGTALVLADAGSWAPRTSYTILTAAGGVGGTFGSVSDNLAFLDPVLSYQPDAVELSLERNDINFNAVAVTPNEQGAATGADALGWTSPLYNALVKLDAPTARLAFDQISGEYHASQETARIDDSRYIREAMDQRLQQGGADPEAAHVDGTRLDAWAHAWGHWTTTDGNGSAGRLADNGDGLLIGADLPVGTQGRVGVTGGASRDSLSVGSRASWGRATSQWLGAFGGYQAGAVALRGGIAYAWDQIPSNREVNFPGYSDRLSGNAAGDTLTGFIEGAWTFSVGQGEIAPFVNLAHTRVETDASTEMGGAAALHASRGSANASFGGVGARGSIQFLHHLDVHGELAWQHAFGNTTPGRTLQFVAGGPAFTEYGVPVADNAGLGRIGLGWHAGNVAINADYEGLFGGGSKDQAAKLSLDIAL